MSVIYLIRHGQASFGADDYDKLSELGRLQAKLNGQALHQKYAQPMRVLTGTMRRHIETAELSLNAFDFNQKQLHKITSQDDRWNEYDHQQILGVYNKALATPDGVRAYLSQHQKPMQHFKKVFIEAMNTWVNAKNSDDYTETFQQFCERVLGALNELRDTPQDKQIMVYSSGGPISLITCHLLGLPLSSFMEINWTLVNTGITKVISRGPKKPMTLSTMNEHHVLEAPNNKQLITYT